jgi:hypothetical protein
MKLRILAVALVLFASTAIGYAKSSPNVSVNLQQLTSTNDTFYFRGPVSIQYRLEVRNPTSQPVTLRSLRLESIGPGAYTIHSGNTPLKLQLGPNESRAVTISAWGRARGGFMSAEEPVTIQGTAYFNSPSGSFVKLFNENIMQP